MSSKKSTRKNKGESKNKEPEVDDTPVFGPNDTETSETQFNNLEDEDVTSAIDELDEDDDLNDDDNLDEEAEIDDEDIEISITEASYDEEDFKDEKCLYKYAKNKETELSEDEESDYDDEFFDDDMEDQGNIVPPEERITKPYLYNFERVRIIGDRAKQIALGAKPMIKGAENLSAKQIAEQELKNRVMPFILERELPNGKKERWYLKELIHQ